MYINIIYNQFQYDTMYHMYNSWEETKNTKKMPRTFIDNGNVRIYTYYQDYLDDKNLGLQQYIITNRFDKYLENKKLFRFVPGYIVARDVRETEADKSLCMIDISSMFYCRHIYEYVEKLDYITTIFDFITLDMSLVWQSTYEKYYYAWSGLKTDEEIAPITDNRIHLRYDDGLGNKALTQAYSNFWVNPCKAAQEDAYFLHCLDVCMYGNDVDSTNYYFIPTDSYISNYFDAISTLFEIDIVKDNESISHAILPAEKSYEMHDKAAHILYTTLDDIENDLFSGCETLEDVKSIIVNEF